MGFTFSNLLVGSIVVGLVNVSFAAVQWEKENRWTRKWYAMQPAPSAAEKYMHPAVFFLFLFRLCEVTNRVLCLGLAVRLSKAAFDGAGNKPGAVPRGSQWGPCARPTHPCVNDCVRAVVRVGAVVRACCRAVVRACV